jgi:hypothetical protein
MQSKNMILNMAKNKVKKRFIKFITGIFLSSTFFGIIIILFIIILIGALKYSFSTATDYTHFSPQVEQYRVMVKTECERQGIGAYVDVVLTIMQCETKGLTSDPMYSSDKISNTNYGKERGNITNTMYSINCGIAEIKDLLKLCNVIDINDLARLNIVFQAYELDRGYITYAAENGGYTYENAKEYIEKYESLAWRNPNFAINASMYMKLLTNALKRFIHPLSIYSTVHAFSQTEPYVIYSGVSKQIVLSCSKGKVTDVIEYTDTSTITITFDDFILVYENVSNANVEINDEVYQGTTIGMVAWTESLNCYNIKLSMSQNGVNIDPEKYLDVLSIKKQPLDQASIDEGVAIAEYAKVCDNNLKYVPGGSTINGCDEIGFIKNVYSNFFSYDEEYYKLPSSWDKLFECKYISYKLTNPDEIISQIMYEGDVIIYQDENGNYTAGIYIGQGKIEHMTISGVVLDNYSYSKPYMLLRFIGKKYLNMNWPLPGYGRDCVSSTFDPQRENPVTGNIEAHNGVDIAAPEGTAVVAAYDGTVIEANYNDSCGYHVVIDHGNGKVTYYLHASALCVEKGDVVTTGDVIMQVGSTGQSTGPHLHFGINIEGEWVDALQYSFINE